MDQRASTPDETNDSGSMSLLEHLDELRSRLFKILYGVGVAFAFSLTFTNQLWLLVKGPAEKALRELGVDPPDLVMLYPTESFQVIWMKLPVLTSIFLSAPWTAYQVWAFLAPGLHERERRWARPVIVCSAGLFLCGGLFAYLVVLRFGLTFLLGVGRGQGVSPLVSVNEYFDLFVNVTLGMGVVFELPVVIFLLTLLHVLNPAFLLSNSRYAILGIVTLAAILTPTPDVMNLLMVSVPMTALFYTGVFASALLVRRREGRPFPWRKLLVIVFIASLLAAFLAAQRDELFNR